MSKQTVTHAHPSGSFWARNRKSGGYLLRKTVRRKCYQLIRFLLLFGLCFMIIQPLLDKLSVSFMAERDLYDSTVISIPRHLTTANYSLAASKILLNYGTTFLNTLIVSLAVSVLQIAACTLVGYGFARFEFPFKKCWFAAVIITVIIPPQTISSSLYLHFNFFDIFGIFKATTGSSLNLRGSPIPYALMSATCMGAEERAVHLHDSPILHRHSEVAGGSGVCGRMQHLQDVLAGDSARRRADSGLLLSVLLRLAVDGHVLLQAVLGEHQAPEP